MTPSRRARDRKRTRSIAALAIVATAALFAGCISTAGGSASPAPSASASPAPSASIAEPSPPQRFRVDGLSLTIPTGWRAWDLPASPGLGMAELRLFTVGAGPWCTSPQSPAPSGAHTDPCPLGGPLPPDSMVVAIYRWDVLGWPGGRTPIGWTAETINGRKAYVFEPPEAAGSEDLRVQWAIERPAPEEGVYAVDARLRGPGLKPLRNELERVLGSATVEPWQTPAPIASAGLVHLALGSFSFDYPSAWARHFLVAVPGSWLWLTTFDPPAVCCNGFVQPPGTVGFSMGTGLATPFDPRSFVANAIVGGLPAHFYDSAASEGPADVHVLRWGVVGPEPDGGPFYTLTATIRGPGETDLRAQVDRVIASIRIEGAAGFKLPTPAP